mmetsp:Transcript_49891/g.68039  ORF Transcript_49891/g.68039 Transcript_49891/m.68039 type:complete len:80 (+) Transcript_49891:1500-1739(+)
MDGLGTEKWPSDNEYKGQWLDNLIQGYGEYTWSDGDKKKSFWLNDKSHGLCKFIPKEGEVSYRLHKNGDLTHTYTPEEV